MKSVENIIFHPYVWQVSEWFSRQEQWPRCPLCRHTAPHPPWSGWSALPSPQQCLFLKIESQNNFNQKHEGWNRSFVFKRLSLSYLACFVFSPSNPWHWVSRGLTYDAHIITCCHLQCPLPGVNLWRNCNKIFYKILMKKINFK